MAKLRVDFTGVESFIKCAEGDHIAVLKEIEEKVAVSSGADMLAVVFEVSKGTSTGARLYDNLVLSEKALWKLKGFLEVLGMKPDGKMNIDLSKLVGRACIVTVVYEEYNGSMKARIEGYRKLDVVASEDNDEDDDDDDEEEEAPKKKKKTVVEEPDEEDEPVETPKAKKKRLALEAEQAAALALKKKKKKPPVEDDDEDWEED